jgi:hypothetical protein
MRYPRLLQRSRGYVVPKLAFAITTVARLNRSSYGDSDGEIGNDRDCVPNDGEQSVLVLLSYDGELLPHADDCGFRAD